jgi:hypothetical protein
MGGVELADDVLVLDLEQAARRIDEPPAGLQQSAPRSPGSRPA